MQRLGMLLTALVLATTGGACSYDYPGATRCFNGDKDGDETGVDCGGSCVSGQAGRCGYGQGCKVSSDCHEGLAQCELDRCTPERLRGVWRKLEPASSPPARYGAGFTNDGDQQLVLFGGVRRVSNVLTSIGDMWTFKHGQWTNRGNVGEPRHYHGQAFVAELGTTLIVGGESQSSAGITRRSDVCTTAKTCLPELGLPEARSKAAMVVAGGKLIVFGGVDQADGLVGDSIALMSRDLSGGATWQHHPSTLPSRFWHEMVHDEERGVVVVYGGCTDYKVCKDHRTALLDPESLEWQDLSELDDPGPLYAQSMAYDRLRKRTVLFGGVWAGDGSDVRTSDTWEWNGTAWRRVETLGSAPPLTSHAALGYDSTGQRMILLLGDEKGADELPNETWAYSVLGWPCDAANDCGEGSHCADGVCCNDPCANGSCDTRDDPGICVAD